MPSVHPSVCWDIDRNAPCTVDDHADNPAIITAHGDECPACRRYTLTRWLGGFADEPPALPHAECVCGYVE